MSSSETKLCPYCSEEIKATAIKCRYCQTMLDGSGQAVPSEPGAGAGPQGGGSSPGTGRKAGPAGGGTGGAGGGSRLGAGVVVNRYQLGRQLGTGGMGEVFLAEHTYTGQKVALKAVWPNLMASEGPRKRFLQEGRLLAQLKHPNIVGLTDFFEEDGRFFLAMEYVEGQTLAQKLDSWASRGMRVPVSDVIRVMYGVLGGLAHAHSHGSPVVHRDIKPSNVMLSNDGRVVLMDFGIAKVAEGEKITHTAGLVGTYEYMSPEQVTGQGVTPATDVYAVGIVAYELLTGSVPFPQRDESGFDAMEGHKYKEPPPIEDRRPDCPAWLVAWVGKALAKVPRERFVDAGEMLSALERGEREPKGERGEAAGSGGGQRAAEEADQAPAKQRGGSGVWPAAFLTLLAIAGIGAAAFTYCNRPSQQKAEEKPKGQPFDPAESSQEKGKALASHIASLGLQWVYSNTARLEFAKTETTVAQYRACVEAGACSGENHYTRSTYSECNWGHSNRDDHPMNCINWNGATQFCSWVGGRLPTEEEWYAEASNGGSRDYPWGDAEATCDRAIWGDGNSTDGCGKDSTWPVCSKTNGNSVSGLCDMSGNVWEWTSTGDLSGRVLRGGSWDDDLSKGLRAAGRLRYDPGLRSPDFGLRCVRVPQ